MLVQCSTTAMRRRQHRSQTLPFPESRTQPTHPFKTDTLLCSSCSTVECPQQQFACCLQGPHTVTPCSKFGTPRFRPVSAEQSCAPAAIYASTCNQRGHPHCWRVRRHLVWSVTARHVPSGHTEKMVSLPSPSTALPPSKSAGRKHEPTEPIPARTPANAAAVKAHRNTTAVATTATANCCTDVCCALRSLPATPAAPQPELQSEKDLQPRTQMPTPIWPIAVLCCALLLKTFMCPCAHMCWAVRCTSSGCSADSYAYWRWRAALQLPAFPCTYADTAAGAETRCVAPCAGAAAEPVALSTAAMTAAVTSAGQNVVTERL